MKEFIEKLIGKLEELRNDKYINGVSRFTPNEKKVFDIAETIVNQLAEEYNNGWISVDDALPELTEGTKYFKQSKLLKVQDGITNLGYGMMIRKSAKLLHGNPLHLISRKESK